MNSLQMMPTVHRYSSNYIVDTIIAKEKVIIDRLQEINSDAG